MKKLMNLAIVLLVALGSHWLTIRNYRVTEPLDEDDGLVTGIGGIFFKVKNPKELKTWYEEHLGFKTNEYGTVFRFGSLNEKEGNGHLQWSPFSEKTTYFKNEFMINYRVTNIEALVTRLKKEGITILDDIETFDYGKFVHILDLNDAKVQLWEPVDDNFAQHLGGAVTGY